MFKVDISKWIAKELHTTELELLRAEDELASAKLRVEALQERAARLKIKGTQHAAAMAPDAAPSPALAAYDRARKAFNRSFSAVVPE